MFRLHALGAAAGQITSGGAPGPETIEGGKGAVKGPRRSRATARRLAYAERPNTGWGAIVRHRAPAATEG